MAIPRNEARPAFGRDDRAERSPRWVMDGDRPTAAVPDTLHAPQDERRDVRRRRTEDPDLGIMGLGEPVMQPAEWSLPCANDPPTPLPHVGTVAFALESPPATPTRSSRPRSRSGPDASFVALVGPREPGLGAPWGALRRAPLRHEVRVSIPDRPPAAARRRRHQRRRGAGRCPVDAAGGVIQIEPAPPFGVRANDPWQLSTSFRARGGSETLELTRRRRRRVPWRRRCVRARLAAASRPAAGASIDVQYGLARLPLPTDLRRHGQFTLTRP